MRNYNDNIYKCSRHLKVIKYDRVHNLSGRMFQYSGARIYIYIYIFIYINAVVIRSAQS